MIGLITLGLNEKTLESLCKAGGEWDTERYKYICVGRRGEVYFSNDLNCDRVRRWNTTEFQAFKRAVAVQKSRV